MKLHELKILDIYYRDVFLGFKTFELRKNDRDYQVGDLIHFTVIPTPKEDNRDHVSDAMELFQLAASNSVYSISYILKDVPQYGLDKDCCILGIKRLEAKS